MVILLCMFMLVLRVEEFPNINPGGPVFWCIEFVNIFAVGLNLERCIVIVSGIKFDTLRCYIVYRFDIANNFFLSDRW